MTAGEDMATAETVQMAPVRLAKVIKPPEKAPVTKLQMHAARMAEAFGTHDKHGVIREMLETLAAIYNEQRLPSPEVNADTAQALAAFLSVFISPQTEIPESMAYEFLRHVALIGNAADSSGIGPLDPFIAAIGPQRQRAFKSTILSSARNQRLLDVQALAKANPSLASSWLSQSFKQAFSGNLNQHVRDNLLSLARNTPDTLEFCRDIQEPYFTCTYLGDIYAERKLKSAINRAAKAVTHPPVNGPVRQRIAVVTEYWQTGHSVYRTLFKYVEALKQDFDLALVHAIREASDFELSLFDSTIKLPYDGLNLDTTPLDGQGFAAVVFPDIGMTASSIQLANVRTAPLQVMLTGHPTSTFGGEIDWFVSGELTETEENAENYSEKHVRLPGFGCIHEKPTYVPQGRKKKTDDILINASWYGQKITPDCLRAIDKAMELAGRPCTLRIFAGSAATNNGAFGAVLRDIGSIVTHGKTEVVPHLPYDAYMALLEEGDFAVDVFPYAGSNTVSDNLWLRKPVVCLEGDRWFSRIGPAMMRSIGIESPQTVSDYVDAVEKLISDDNYRQSITAHVEAADLDSTIYQTTGVAEFRDFIRAKTTESAAHSR